MERSLFSKLGGKGAEIIDVINTAPNYPKELLTADHFNIIEHFRKSSAVFLVFIASRKEFLSIRAEIQKAFDENKILWIAYPKKNTKEHIDLTRNSLAAEMRNINFIPINQIMIDQIWSAMRFKIKSDKPTKLEQFRETDEFKKYIDLEKRVVKTPNDFQTILDKNPIAKQMYERLSFTHKKEIVLSIIEAKKLPTRNKRLTTAIQIIIGNRND